MPITPSDSRGIVFLRTPCHVNETLYSLEPIPGYITWQRPPQNRCINCGYPLGAFLVAPDPALIDRIEQAKFVAHFLRNALPRTGYQPLTQKSAPKWRALSHPDT